MKLQLVTEGLLDNQSRTHNGPMDGTSAGGGTRILTSLRLLFRTTATTIFLLMLNGLTLTTSTDTETSPLTKITSRALVSLLIISTTKTCTTFQLLTLESLKDQIRTTLLTMMVYQRTSLSKMHKDLSSPDKSGQMMLLSQTL